MGATPEASPLLGSMNEAQERSPAEVWGEAGRSSSKGGNDQERSDLAAG